MLAPFVIWWYFRGSARFCSPIFHMPELSLTNRAIFKTVDASLKLASSSSELLTISQLLAIKDNLQATLAVISGQIQTENSGMFAENILNVWQPIRVSTGDYRVVIDMSDWESASDEEKEDRKEGASTAGGKYPIRLTPQPLAHGDHR